MEYHGDVPQTGTAVAPTAAIVNPIRRVAMLAGVVHILQTMEEGTNTSKEFGLALQAHGAFQRHGAGKFRDVYSTPDTTKVVKVAVGRPGLRMNKVDYQAGTDSQVDDVFAKAFALSPSGLWIIVDKVARICTTKDLLNTFPVLAGMLHPDLTKDTQHAAIWNRTDQAFDFGYGDGPQTHREWYSGHHQWYVFQNAVAYATLGASSAAELAEEARNASQPIYDLQGIVETLNRVSAFRAICHAVVKYNIDIHELTANNMGVLTSGRLVILDTSVKGHAPAPKWGWKNLI